MMRGMLILALLLWPIAYGANNGVVHHAVHNFLLGFFAIVLQIVYLIQI